MSGGLGARDSRLTGFKQSKDKSQVLSTGLVQNHLLSHACSSRTLSHDTGAQVSVAESRRAAEHKQIVVARRATLRSLRNRKSLAACGSSLRGFYATADANATSLRIQTAKPGDAGGGLSERETSDRRHSLSWANLEEDEGDGGSESGTRRTEPKPDEGFDRNPVRGALPMINQGSFKSKALRQAASGLVS